jgi:putative ATP-dependent endonuclease of the OLD family
MIVNSIHVKNFRSIYDEKIDCERLTALVGANGSGKSSFLHALRLFYTKSPKIDFEDFYNKNTEVEISITITFKDLSDNAKKRFLRYLQNENLTVERIFFYRENGKLSSLYHGSTLQNPDFHDIKQAFEIKDRGKTAESLYEKIKETTKYRSLPEWGKPLQKNFDTLVKWEADHPDQCTRSRDDGQFFGFTEVAQGYLGEFTQFLFIPAVKEANEEAYESKDSVLTKLMYFVVRSVLEEKKEVIKLRETTQANYEKIMNPEKITELKELSSQLTTTLKQYVPDAKIELTWLPLGQIEIPLPSAEVKLLEDGYSTTVDRTGHGLQRVFILTILQHLSVIQMRFAQLQQQIDAADERTPETSTTQFELPDLILAIEEPELFQHPNRQRHFSKVLLQLANGALPGVAEKTQIIYCTHSPLFVGIDRINEIRLLKKVENNLGNPKITKVIRTNLGCIAEKMCNVYAESPGFFTEEKIIPRLKSIMTPWMNEGFFADVVVLVEGEDDRAAILGISLANNIDLEAQGFAIIPCNGKTNIDRPYLIFTELGIPVYVLWDSDSGKGATEGSCIICRRPLDKKANPIENQRILRLIGATEIIDWPKFVDKSAACFEKDLESTLKEELGIELYDSLIKQFQEEFSISEKKNAQKNPIVIMNIIKTAREKGKTCVTLEKIVQKIRELKK